ncbi:hypothetical protein AX17_007224 [Amanita inopinata Kibby_2008]|nr:hypothetical protein AX17_007224 [Amanita inopinata Kibby_2008]
MTESQLVNSYDFVIAGGGLAGLTLASLSEDSYFSVPVLEAGESGIPDYTYHESLVGSSYDWDYMTVPQPNVSNQPRMWPEERLIIYAGHRVLCGSSAINGMYYVRPSAVEVDAWENLIASDDLDAAKAWSWDQFYAAMQRSETFTPPAADVQQKASITYQHSSFGPVHVTYLG